MIRCAILLAGLGLLSNHLCAQVIGDGCANPYQVTLQDPLSASCDFVEITGLDFTNFGDDVVTPSPSCDFGTNNNDIWVKLIVPPNADGFKITMDSSVVTAADNDYQNFKVAVYIGSSCGSLTYKTCKSSSRARVYNNYFDGFSAGDPLYVRIYTDNSPSGTWDKPFFARFTSISTGQSNDACTKAAALIPGNYCNHLATDKGENDNKAPDKLTSTSSVCDPGNSEFGSFDNNQWYYFDVTATTPQPVQITISNVNCSAGDKILQVAIWKANTMNCGSWGNGYNLNTPASASEGDLLACAVGTGTITLSENLPVGKYWYTVDGSAGSFCEYSITNAPVVSVPIRLIDFYANSIGDKDHLYWSCMEVTTSSYFVIEKSMDGKYFSEIGRIAVSEHTSGLSSFDFETERGIGFYYRIRIVEPALRNYYSTIIYTGNNIQEQQLLAAYISGDDIHLFLNNKISVKTSVKIINIEGKEIVKLKEKELLPGENRISRLDYEIAPGIYFLQILLPDKLYNFKLVQE